MEIVYDESTGTWGEREEPYTTLDVQTEEDWNKLELMINNFSRLEEENKELKRLLKLAVEDIGKHSFCSMCENRSDDSKCKKCKAVTLDMFKWKHVDEAMKLIGDEDNV